MLMALLQREDCSPVILHTDSGFQFTSGKYQRFLNVQNLVCSMSAVGSCADNRAMGGALAFSSGRADKSSTVSHSS